MTSAKHIFLTNQENPIPAWLENTLLCMVLGLLVLRATMIETPLVDQPRTPLRLSAENITLLISTVLLFCMGVWFLAAVLRGRFRWYKTGFGMMVGVFVVAGVLNI